MMIDVYTVYTYTSRAARSGEKRRRYASHSGLNIREPLHRSKQPNYKKGTRQDSMVRPGPLFKVVATANSTSSESHGTASTMAL